ncbi:cytochrome [Mycobacterium alsense]|uniref:Cytochrome n=1 Tax=Mycobacterium alsense TaxID=324058 RepID=A0ABD6NUJ3_9MYCO|nr:cytochrome P450 [Mycobacterium alsense]OBG27304.1 cytochrome [Mycobacterium alsense]
MNTSTVAFDPFSAEFFNDPYPIYRRLRDEAPVYYNAHLDFYALSRHDDVAAAFKDFETYSSSRGVTLDQVSTGEVLKEPLVQFMDPPAHRRMRGLVNKVFTPRAIAAQESIVRATIDRYFSRLDPDGFDVVADFSAYFPVEVITTMLGVPEEDRQSVRHYQDEVMKREPGTTTMSAAGKKAVEENGLLYYNLIQQRRAEPRGDMISALIAVEVDRDDGTKTKLDDVEITGFCMLLGGAGAETVTKLIGSAMVLFSQHRDQWDRLRADRTKIPDAVEEVLRFDGPVQYDCRYSLSETQLHGVTIPAHETVMLLPASANRDERAFTHPDTFDINRDRTEAQNLGFGYGIHSCLGAALARMESRIALDRLLDVLPWFEVASDELRRVSMTNVNGYANVPIRPSK